MAGNAGDGIIRCRRCGRVVGRMDGNRLTIRHKGRSVTIFQMSGEMEVEIACEGCRSVTRFRKISQSPCFLT